MLEDAETISRLQRLATHHATIDPAVAPLPPVCFRSCSFYQAYRSTYDAHRTLRDGPEYFINPDGSRTYNTAWLGGYGWFFLRDAPDAIDLANQLSLTLENYK